MNFYKSQDDALKKTKLLVLYFALAILGTISLIYSLISAGKLFFSSNKMDFDSEGKLIKSTTSFWDIELFITVGGITSLVILAGWFYKRMQIGNGGSAVAQSMGARPVFADTTDPDEKQLINVVEEMAIASGMPVPEVWVMDKDSGINAFSAGTEPGNAVIGVTRGTMKRLTRAELQGLIAHEFSHIMNGDMKMNIRLMCMLHGLLLITIIGYTVFRLAIYSSNRRSSKEEGGARMAMIGIALVLIIAGTVGAFFAAMIQAAISRQREYLADAYAVEFTMDPNGIGGALKKIGGTSHRASVSSPVASEMEHMFFASSGLFRYGFKSHPPLEERIGIIEPEWDGSYVDSQERSIGELVNLQQSQNKPSSVFENMMPQAVIAGAVLEQLGETSSMKASHGKSILQSIDPSWINACHDKYKAQLMIYGMLVAEDGELHQNEIQHLTQTIGQEMTEIVLYWRGQLAECKSSQQIALIDLCIPTLRKLSRDEYAKFIDMTQWLIKSDNSVNLFEFMLQKVLQRHLDAHFGGRAKAVIKYPNLQSLHDDLEVILSTIAGVGANSEEMLQDAFAEANRLVAEYGSAPMNLLSPDQCGIQRIDQALKNVEKSSPLTKKQLLLVCSQVVMHDGIVTDREAELLRATADAIGCSVPPFVSDIGT